MVLNEIIDKCAKKCRIGTYLHANVFEANTLLENVTEYPVLLYLFQGTIYESDSGLRGHVKRDVTLFFYDSLGILDADTKTEVAPMAERMLAKAVEFVDALRDEGVDVNSVRYNPSVSIFDAMLAGVRCELTVTYKACEYGRPDCHNR